MQVTETITAGRLICGFVRDALKQAKFKGFDIEWLESSGWIERTFTIKGNPQHVQTVVAAIVKSIEEAERET